MSKLIIEQALQKAIQANNQHEVSLQGGEELAFTTNMSDCISACYDEVGIPNHGGNERVDLVKYSNSSRRQIKWALEAKHFTPHQKKKLNRLNPKGYSGYLEYSLSGFVEAKVDVTIHYLINGPFKYKELYPRLIDTTNPFPLDPTIPFEKQVGLGNPISAWDIDVSIASDTEE